ncbi:MAG: hypothetical protein PF694_15020 [Bacteroidetes bacterium]|jgi:hypothetical protein|nr:hypothetical protein [Bacteroidota bacterium]
MNKLALLLIITIGVIFNSCKKDECGECFTPPAPFVFELIDAASGEQIFLFDSLNINDFEIKNSSDNSLVQYNFEPDFGTISLHTIGWKTEMVNYDFYLKDELLFHFFVNAERKLDNCCSFTVYHEIKLEGVTYEFIADRGVYRVFVE